MPPSLPRTDHFGFRVGDPDEVSAARERLRDARVEEAEWQDDGRFTRVQVADPLPGCIAMTAVIGTASLPNDRDLIYIERGLAGKRNAQ